MHVRKIRQLPPASFLVLSRLRFDDDVVADSAMIARLQEGKVMEARGYISDEDMLVRLGLLADAGSSPLDVDARAR